MSVLVTGVAGFIGNAVAESLLSRGESVQGIDNLNDYYDVTLKRDRLERLAHFERFSYSQSSLEDMDLSSSAFDDVGSVIHLAAQSGVRYSLVNPDAYIASNLVGFSRVLEFCRTKGVDHLVYASSSSVYGANRRRPFSIGDDVNQPVSLYAATKRANELMAESYSHLFGIPMTGLRFFTVYGPWGRPDMAIFDFTKKILAGEPIRLFGRGELSRDFTYIDDIVQGVLLCHAKVPRPTEYGGPGINETRSPHVVLNLGRGSPVIIMDMVRALELSLGTRADLELVERQLGDVDHTLSDISDTELWCGYRPDVTLVDGILRFVDWFTSYNG